MLTKARSHRGSRQARGTTDAIAPSLAQQRMAEREDEEAVAPVTVLPTQFGEVD